MLSMQIEQNGYFKDWVPGTQKSLFTTSHGEDTRYRMIDWSSGAELWDITCPANGEALAIGLTPRLVLFDVAELYEFGGPWRGSDFIFRNSKKEWTRAFYAVGVDDGKIIASFKPHFSARLNLNGWERFTRLGNKLYFVTHDEFVELSEEDVFAGKNGWERITAPK